MFISLCSFHFLPHYVHACRSKITFAEPQIHGLVYEPTTGLATELKLNMKEYIDDLRHVYDLYQVFFNFTSVLYGLRYGGRKTFFPLEIFCHTSYQPFVFYMCLILYCILLYVSTIIEKVGGDNIRNGASVDPRTAEIAKSTLVDDLLETDQEEAEE